MKKWLLGIVLMLASCSSQINDVHSSYLNDWGWTINKQLESETYMMDLPEEMLANYKANDLTFFQENAGQKVTQTVYLLKEKDIEGERLKAVLLEHDGEIIGGYGVLPSWTPGVFRLDAKQQLIDEKKIKE